MHKVVLITGAAQRIGKETAKVFAEDNWNVIIHFNSSFEAASELAAELNAKRAGSACIIQADLDIDADVERLVIESKKAFGRMDALINNASTLMFNFGSHFTFICLFSFVLRLIAYFTRSSPSSHLNFLLCSFSLKVLQRFELGFHDLFQVVSHGWFLWAFVVKMESPKLFQAVERSTFVIS